MVVQLVRVHGTREVCSNQKLEVNSQTPKTAKQLVDSASNSR